MDSKYQLPAGHMDGNETMVTAMIRELKEEIDIDVKVDDIRVVHISHRVSIGREYFDAYLEVLQFSGTPKVNEPEKCGDLSYFDIRNIETKNFVVYDIDVVQMIENGVHFSDADMKNYK